jgi:uncharacterized protein YjiS (DUF1127 family)
MSLVSLEAQTFALRRFVVYVAESIGVAWARYLFRRARSRDLAILSAMDDVSLKDIGITRLDIRAAIRSDRDLRPRN